MKSFAASIAFFLFGTVFGDGSVDSTQAVPTVQDT